MNRQKYTIFLLSLTLINYHISFAKKTEGPRTENTHTLLEDIDRRLQNASRLGKVKKVESLIKRGANINAQDGVGYAPLHLAAMYGYDAIVKILLEKGAAIEIKNDDQATPLFLAAGKDNVTIIKLLLERGAEVTTHNKYGETILHEAGIGGNKKIMKLLIKTDVVKFINSCSHSNYLYNRTPLYEAAEKNNAYAVRILLRHGADQLKECDTRQIVASPVEAALWNRNTKIVRILKASRVESKKSE